MATSGQNFRLMMEKIYELPQKKVRLAEKSPSQGFKGVFLFFGNL
jgi:hypothetical protein